MSWTSGSPLSLQPHLQCPPGRTQRSASKSMHGGRQSQPCREVRLFTRVIFVGPSQKEYVAHTNRLTLTVHTPETIDDLDKNVDDPQVILRPRPSTRGRSNRQRLFLRQPSTNRSATFVWTVRTMKKATPTRAKQGRTVIWTSV